MADLPRSSAGGFMYCRGAGCDIMISVPRGGVALCPTCQERAEREAKQEPAPADEGQGP